MSYSHICGGKDAEILENSHAIVATSLGLLSRPFVNCSVVGPPVAPCYVRLTAVPATIGVA